MYAVTKENRLIEIQVDGSAPYEADPFLKETNHRVPWDSLRCYQWEVGETIPGTQFWHEEKTVGRVEFSWSVKLNEITPHIAASGTIKTDNCLEAVRASLKAIRQAGYSCSLYFIEATYYEHDGQVIVSELLAGG